MAGWRKWNDQDALVIKQLLFNGYRHGHINRDYPMTQQAVQQIMRGETYADIPWPDGTYGALSMEVREEHFDKRKVARSFGRSSTGKLANTPMSRMSDKLRADAIDAAEAEKYGISLEQLRIDRAVLSAKAKAEMEAEDRARSASTESLPPIPQISDEERAQQDIERGERKAKRIRDNLIMEIVRERYSSMEDHDAAFKKAEEDLIAAEKNTEMKENGGD